MKTLLTGANGLVGSTLTADIMVVGRKPPVPDSKEPAKRWADLRSYGQTLSLFNSTRPTHVIHTAARVGGLGANMKYMADFFHDNMLINLNVLECSRKVGVEKIVSFLSTCIFPDKVDYPLVESALHNGPPHDSNYGYAYAKRMLEVHGRALENQYGMKNVCVIPTNIYGANDNFNLENSHVVPALIHKFYLAKQDETDVVVWGSGKPLREFIFADDVGDITQLILEHYEGTEPLILSNSEEVSIGDLAETIAEAMDYQGKIIFDDSKPDGQFRKPTCNLRLQDFVPEYKFTSLEKGIKQTVEWFKENYETCRK